MNKENRKIIEQMIELINQNEYKEYDDENKFLRSIKYDLEKFKVKYDYFDKYNVVLNKDNIRYEENIDIDSKYSRISIYRIKGTDNQRILNSDKQPNNELLMVYSHSTGSYMFGGTCWDSNEYYDSDLFDMYFEELKTYKYKYIDELNHHLYFDLEEGFKLYKEYKNICDKYQKLFNERRNKVKLEKLQEQIEILKQEEDKEVKE